MTRVGLGILLLAQVVLLAFVAIVGLGCPGGARWPKWLSTPLAGLATSVALIGHSMALASAALVALGGRGGPGPVGRSALVVLGGLGGPGVPGGPGATCGPGGPCGLGGAGSRRRL